MLCTLAGQLNDMELENQVLQAQLADGATQLQNATAAHAEASASTEGLRASLKEAEAGAAATAAELTACISKVCVNMHAAYSLMTVQTHMRWHRRHVKFSLCESTRRVKCGFQELIFDGLVLWKRPLQESDD